MSAAAQHASTPTSSVRTPRPARSAVAVAVAVRTNANALIDARRRRNIDEMSQEGVEWATRNRSWTDERRSGSGQWVAVDTDGEERAEAEVRGEQFVPHVVAGEGIGGPRRRQAARRVQREARLDVENVDERDFAQLCHHVNAKRQEHSSTRLQYKSSWK